MRDIDLLLSRDGSLLNQLRNNISKADRISFITAFGSLSGFNLIRDSFGELMSNAGSARFIFDITQGMTSPELIEELATYPGEVSVKISTSEADAGFMHSKLYVFEGLNNAIIAGSSNFSMGGLRENIESCIQVSNPPDEFFEETTSFIATLWHSKYSIDPTVHPDIFEEYKKIHAEWSSERFSEKRSLRLNDLSKKIKMLNVDEEYENNNLDLFYLLGLLAANIKFQSTESISSGALEFRYKSQIQNSNNPSERGYITSIIDGERLGDIKLDQLQTMKKYVTGIVKKIEEFLKLHDPDVRVNLEDRTQSSVNFIIKINFKKNNIVLESIAKYFELCKSKSPEGIVTPVLPSNMNKIEKNVGIHFAQGYTDFRSRLSQADKVGRKLRIGVQIDKDAVRFLYEFRDYLQRVHDLEVNVNDGSARGKDNMLRITASAGTNALFNSTWQKQMNAEFAKYNSR